MSTSYTRRKAPTTVYSNRQSITTPYKLRSHLINNEWELADVNWVLLQDVWWNQLIINWPYYESDTNYSLRIQP